MSVSTSGIADEPFSTTALIKTLRNTVQLGHDDDTPHQLKRAAAGGGEKEMGPAAVGSAAGPCWMV